MYPEQELAYHRRTAADWHSGPFSPLYSFASTGRINNYGDLVDEVYFCLQLAGPAEHDRLLELLHYIHAAKDQPCQ